MEEEKKKEITNKYSEYRNNETRKSIEKDMTSTIVKLLIVTIVIDIIFFLILFYIYSSLLLIRIVFAVIFIAPVLFKLYSIKSDKNIKYKDKEEKE